MKSTKKALVIFFACITVLSIVLTGCGTDNTASDNSASDNSASQQITIRYGSADAEDAAVVQGLYAFKEYVEQASNGTIKVEPYINGVLGGDRELCEGLQIGSVDMCIVMGGILANYDERFNIFGLPYLWKTKQASYDAVDGEFGNIMEGYAEDFNFKLLGWGDGGTYQVANTGKPITSLSDIKGVKLRVPEIDMDIAFFSALGATPTPVSFSETYTALEQGVVDGLELSVELMYCSQMMDPVDYLTLTNHVQCVFPILMSPDCWNKLDSEQQKIVMAGIEKQVLVNRQVAEDAEETYIQKFKDMGKTVYELSDEAMAEFVAVGEQVQVQYEDSLGIDLIELAKSYNK